MENQLFFNSQWNFPLYFEPFLYTANISTYFQLDSFNSLFASDAGDIGSINFPILPMQCDGLRRKIRIKIEKWNSNFSRYQL